MKKTNLKVYSEGLGVDEINGIVARMTELGNAVRTLEDAYDSDDYSETSLGWGNYGNLEEESVLTLANDLDRFVKELGREPLFGDILTGAVTKEDYAAIINRYHSLMTEQND
ncbi:MAG: hypothetical protein IKM61_00825 [Eubacteriaceae bacterium]|nr:hypothetical protein [Eubacteriaceae bacterium]